MNNVLLQNILARGNDDTENLVSILIFVVFGIIAILKNILAAKKQKSQQQKRPVPQRQVQTTRQGSEKAKIQKERVEQFLESILQTKRSPQQERPAGQTKNKPQMEHSIPVPVRKTEPAPAPVKPKIEVSISNKEPLYEPLNIRDIKLSVPAQEDLGSEELLGTSIMELPSIDTKLQQLPQSMEENQQEVQKESQPAYEKKSSSIFSSFSDTDDLKKAILFTEILGKPISMRES